MYSFRYLNIVEKLFKQQRKKKKQIKQIIVRLIKVLEESDVNNW